MRRRADIYFTRTAHTLRAAELDPMVTMEVFCRKPGMLFGMGDARALIQEVATYAGGAREIPY